jgi:hypothetical protein
MDPAWLFQLLRGVWWATQVLWGCLVAAMYRDDRVNFMGGVGNNPRWKRFRFLVFAFLYVTALGSSYGMFSNCVALVGLITGQALTHKAAKYLVSVSFGLLGINTLRAYSAQQTAEEVSHASIVHIRENC